jgi:PAS domain-containing protein
VPLLSANGQIRKWFGTCTDIEQIKRIEQKLKDANAFLDAIIENIPLTLFIKEGQSLRFVRFNRAGEGPVGRPREEIIGKNDYESVAAGASRVLHRKRSRDPERRQGRRHRGRTGWKRAIKAPFPAYQESPDPRRRGSA